MGAPEPGGMSPLDVMLTLMRQKWDNGDQEGAAQLAKSAAPYMHGRVPPEAPKRSLTTLSDEELALWVDRLDPVEDEGAD